jgi:hypothetical protein
MFALTVIGEGTSSEKKRFAKLLDEVSALNDDRLLSIHQLTFFLLQEHHYQHVGYPDFSQQPIEAA